MNEIFAKTSNDLKDSQRLGRWDKLNVYLSDRERPWKTANDPVILFLLYGNQQKTFGDRQRLVVSKFGAKSSNLNERLWKTVNGHERLSTTLKDSQRLAVIAEDPETRITAKDRQQHSATGNDYMETRLNNWRNGA